MKDKLELLLREKQLNATSLARLLEIQPSGISHILSGRNKPSFDLVVKILRAFPDVNPDWLLLDSTEVWRDEKGDAQRSTLFSDYEPNEDNNPNITSEKNIEFSESNPEIKNEEPTIFHHSKNGVRNIERVVVLYSDGSFDSYTRQRLRPTAHYIKIYYPYILMLRCRGILFYYSAKHYYSCILKYECNNVGCTTLFCVIEHMQNIFGLNAYLSQIICEEFSIFWSARTMRIHNYPPPRLLSWSSSAREMAARYGTSARQRRYTSYLHPSKSGVSSKRCGTTASAMAGTR